MNSFLKIFPSIFLTLNLTSASAGNILFPNTFLYANQYIETTSRNYSLHMQADGNLVMYRKDGSVRWGSGKHSLYALMQDDGNFVQYNSFGGSMWNTETGRNPGAILTIQDDGNLVIYLGSRPLWNIGTEPGPGDPRMVGDVVGRNLDVTGLGSIGHLGVWDGAHVIEVLSGYDRIIRFNSIGSFKSESSAEGYWGKVSPSIPDGFVHGCYYSYCPLFGGAGAEWTDYPTRSAIARRARQIDAIGADYTIFSTSTRPAQPAYEYGQAKRGVYRSDTFIVDLFQATAYAVSPTSAQLVWRRRAESLTSMDIMLPRTLFEKIKTFE